jgi:hypothetical protein
MIKIALKYSASAKGIWLILLLLATLISGCETKKKKIIDRSKHYMAINDRDTAHLRITEDETEFYGSYEILYGRTGKDSGEVRGQIIKDTLRGIFTYKPFGGGYKKSIPIALLKKDDMLYLGKGTANSYLNIPHFIATVPIDYSDSKFLFKEVIISNNK